MASSDLVVRLRHHHLPVFCCLTEAGQHCEAKHKGISVLDAGLHLRQVLCHVSIALHSALGRELIGFLVGLFLEEAVLVVILPDSLWAHTELLHAFDSVTNHSTRITVYAALHVPLIVVDEQPAGGEVLEIRMVLHILLVQGEVIGSCQGICRTAAQVALVEDGEATVLRTQIHYLLGSLALLLDLLGSLLGGGKGHVQVTMIWDIWNPTHLLRARQGHGLHPGIPGGVNNDLSIIDGLAQAPGLKSCTFAAPVN
mmetsp:Transcript_32976/g.71105  ORF Transcript_32976/g.71105 Transcript_32976/m.71105 type:complete len:255 (-) Transcript_32976:6-770(-)